MIEKSELQNLAEQLQRAETERVAVEPFSARFPELNVDVSRDIQLINVARRLREGERIVGYKLGLTSREAQAHFKVFQPDFGHLFETMSVEEEGVLELKSLIRPKIEAEIAFVMGKDLRGPGVTVADAAVSVDCALASLEIIDSRFKDWKVTAADLIADNAASSRFVLGSVPRKITDLDLTSIGMALSCNGEVMVTASGAAVMGSPLNAIVFLANQLGKSGRGLQAGDIVLSGSLGGMLNITATASYTAEFQGLGRVSVRSMGEA